MNFITELDIQSLVVSKSINVVTDEMGRNPS